MERNAKKNKDGKNVRLDELFVELQRDAQAVEPGIPNFESGKVKKHSILRPVLSTEELRVKDSPYLDGAETSSLERIGYQDETSLPGQPKKRFIWLGMILFVVLSAVALVLLFGHIL